MAEETRLQKSRKRLRAAGVAVAVAAAALAGNQAGTGPDLPEAGELAAMMGTLNPDGITYQELRFHPENGRLEGVTVEVPTADWPSGKLLDYHKRLYLFHVRVEELREARAEFEAAYTDSLAAAGRGAFADSLAAAWKAGKVTRWDPHIAIAEPK